MSGFEFRPAVRADVPLIIGIAGSTGSGKTYSALRVAQGLAGGRKFAVIDTENGRALHYADEFAFDHGALDPPFTPDRYAEAIKAADDAGYAVIVVDSASHEHAGDGGLLDMHDTVLTRMAGTDWKKREACTFGAWVEPKQKHKAFVNRLLQVNAHLVLCFRAEEKIELGKDERGKLEVRPKRSLVGLDGWMPVAEKNLPYELTVSVLLTADAPGIPKPIKLQQQHRLLVPLDAPLSEQTGEALAAWARGDADDETAGAVRAVTAELLDLADRLGKREDTTAAVQKNRRANAADAQKHLDWLAGQLDNATAAVEAIADEQVEFDAA